MIKGNLFYGFRAVFPRFPGQGELPWQNANRNTATTPSPCWRGPTGCANAPGGSSAPTGWRGANTRCLRSSPTPSTRPGRATAGRSSSPASGMGESRWRTSAGAAPWTGTRRWASTTGSWCSASSTPEASTTTPPGTTMSTPWASTAWGPAPPSTPRPSWTSPSAGTASGTTSTLKKAAWWGRCRWPPPTGKRRAPPSPGCPTWRSLPRSTSPRSTSPTSSTARRW